MSDTLPVLYSDLAEWFHLLTRPEEYAEEAGIYREMIQSALPSTPQTIPTMLELGSGGGNNASHLKHHFRMTLVDLSREMLNISRRVNPELPHHQGDMRTFRTDQRFDVVFVHDAVMYLTEEEDLRQAVQTAALHTRPGGVVLFVPDCVRETFKPNTEHGGNDASEVAAATAEDVQKNRGLRYMEWDHDPNPDDTSFISDMVYMLREGSTTRCVHDRHIYGIFPRATWLRLFEEAGLKVQVLPFIHSEVEPGLTEVFLGIKESG